MTLAEIVLALAGAVGIYFLLRPLQRRLERFLRRKFAGRSHGHLATIDITDFKSRSAHEKEDEQHDIDS
jgi:hypothetical protein